MHLMRESWTDARLDDFAVHTDRRFDSLERRFDSLERRVDSLERRMEDGFERLNSRIDALQRTVILSNATLFAAIIGLIATQL
jgi:tetrahydromethanopterin S-methyltransferase subunit G